MIISTGENSGGRIESIRLPINIILTYYILSAVVFTESCICSVCMAILAEDIKDDK